MSATSVFAIMLPAFFECLVLVGIFSYLGIHVIKRKVIFVDLALAQIAALGSLIGFLFGISLHSTGALIFSIGLTAVGAAIFSLTRFRESKIPQEAVIGLVYAISAGIAILLIDKAPHGAEHIKEILTGSILWVKWKTVGITAAVCAAAGVFHYIFRDRFIFFTENPERAWAEGLPVRLWDFLFYLSFGIVITLSVNTAGVLLVFVFLVAPAIIAIMFAERWGTQLLIGWGLGLCVTTAGLVTSYFADLPTGPAVIGVYGIAMVLISNLHFVVRSANPGRAALRSLAVAGGFAVVAVAFIAGGLLLGNAGTQDKPSHGHSGAVHDEDPMQADSSDPEGGKTPGPGSLRQRFEAESDPLERMKLAVRALDTDPAEGADLALEFLASDPPSFYRQELISKLDEVLGQPSGFDFTGDFNEPVNRRAAAKIRNRFGIPDPEEDGEKDQ